MERTVERKEVIRYERGGRHETGPDQGGRARTDFSLRLYDMNGIFQMQGGKNRILPK